MRRMDRLSEALSSAGARLKRAGKHLVYELPNGKTFVTAKTPSDVRAELNAISDLRKAAGVERPMKSPRVARPPKPGREEPERWGLPAEDSPFAAALRRSGLVEQQLRSRIGQLERDLSALERWWPVRIGRWLQRWIKVGPALSQREP